MFLDLSECSLYWSDEYRKFIPLPEFFLHGYENLVWLKLGNFNYMPSNMCRDCRNLRFVYFTVEPERIAQKAFYDLDADAVCILNGKAYALEDFVAAYGGKI